MSTRSSVFYASATENFPGVHIFYEHMEEEYQMEVSVGDARGSAVILLRAHPELLARLGVVDERDGAEAKSEM